MEPKDKRTTDERRKFMGTIRPIQEKDLEGVRPILEEWVKNPDTGEPIPEEIEQDITLIRQSLIGENKRSYFVAVEEGSVTGLIGMTPPDEIMRQFATTPNPIEFVNAYVAQSERVGRGIGTQLFTQAEMAARGRGHTEAIFNSGPRYKETAWEFYDNHMPGYSRVGIAHDYYGQGADAPVWGKVF